jgi:hypothetical protein
MCIGEAGVGHVSSKMMYVVAGSVSKIILLRRQFLVRNKP